MKKAWLGILVGTWCGLSLGVGAQEPVTIPWSDIKQWHRESIERELKERQSPDPVTEPVISMDRALYHIQAGIEHALGTVVLTGRLVEGPRVPIDLFPGHLALDGPPTVDGGILLRVDDRIALMPEGTNTFQVELGFLLPVEEDLTSSRLSWTVPPALVNELTIELPDGYALIDVDGAQDREGIFRFAPRGELTVRYQDERQVEVGAEVEAFTVFDFPDEALRMTLYLKSTAATKSSVELLVSAEMRLLASSVKSSWISRTEPGHYRLDLPAGSAGVHHLMFEQGLEGNAADTQIMLPGVADREPGGYFAISHPEDLQVQCAAEGLQQDVPMTRLSRALLQASEVTSGIQHVPGNTALQVQVQRYQPVSTPDVIVETMQFFSVFDESGSSLNVLRVEVPATSSRLTWGAVPGADIWSLTVNSVNKTVYQGDDGAWILPVEQGVPNHIELGYLVRGEPLGLHGQVRAVLPETGLPARVLQVGLALPERVQLLALDGPVHPAPSESFPAPDGTDGQTYFFSRSFFGGGQVELAAAYKEPAQP